MASTSVQPAVSSLPNIIEAQTATRLIADVADALVRLADEIGVISGEEAHRMRLLVQTAVALVEAAKS